MAQTKQPYQVILGNNNRRHLSKAEIQERKDSEIKVDSDKVKPPAYLSKELKKEFKKLADELLKVKLISNLDVDLLARYLILRQEFIEVSDKIQQEPIMTKYGESEIINGNYRHLITAQTKLTKEIRSAAMDLGLSLGARLKLVFPKGEKPNDGKKSEGEKLFGDII